MGRTPAGQTRDKVFHFVRGRLLAGRPPTVREVQDAFSFASPQTARQHLEGLVAEGRLTKEPGQARGYRLPDLLGEPPAVLVPLLGRVAAGPLGAAVEDLEGYVAVQLARGSRRDDEELFGLRVDGESMIGAGILPGDIVIVRRQARMKTGDIVVALVGDEATIKRLHLHHERVELRAENPNFAPIVPDPRQLALLGKVIEVRRYLR
jgi:repressor LexA